MDFDEIADELYALTPAEFTEARDEAAARAHRAGERPLAQQIRALRRLTRTHQAETAALLDLGRALRAAQEHLSAPELRDLLSQRHQVVLTLVDQARDDARNDGLHIGDGSTQELEETLQATLADPDAAAALEAGRLTTALRPGADINLPIASEGDGDVPPPNRPTGAPAARGTKARSARSAAAGSTRAADGLARLEAEAADLATQVEQAKRDIHSAEKKARSAQKHATRAQGAAEDAEHAVQRARAALEQAEAARDTAAANARTRGEEAATAATRVREATSRIEGLTARLNTARERRRPAR